MNNIKNTKHIIKNINFISYTGNEDVSLKKEFIKVRKHLYESDKIMVGLLSKGKEDEFDNDENTHFILACLGNKCIGGIRMTVKYYGSDTLLPLELAKVNIYSLFPYFANNKIAIAQISKLCILAEYRNSQLTYDLVYLLLKKLAVSINIKRYFCITNSKIRSRMFIMLVKKMGLSALLLDDIQIPKNESTEYIDNMIIAMSHAKEDVNVAFARDYKNREESYG